MERIFRKVKNNKGKEYSVMLTLTDDGEVILEKSSCDCIFGSWFRFGKHWRDKKKLCWHMEKVIGEIKNEKIQEKTDSD